MLTFLAGADAELAVSVSLTGSSELSLSYNIAIKDLIREKSTP